MVCGAREKEKVKGEGGEGGGAPTDNRYAHRLDNILSKKLTNALLTISHAHMHYRHIAIK